MKTRTNVRTLQTMFLALSLLTLAACGGGSSRSDVDPATVPLTAAVTKLTQEAFDGITSVVDSLSALMGTQLSELQTEFDGFSSALSSDSVLMAAEIQSEQNTLDDYTQTTDASAALTRTQIQLAQEALDTARPLS